MSENNTENTQQEQPNRPRGIEALQAHITSNKVDSALWASRMLTIIFAVGYILPIFGNAQASYYKIFMANAITSALRLHQRLPRIQLSREFLSLLFCEDSFHYLFFSLIFLYVAPVLLIPLPIVLFAVLHSASYSLTLLDVSITTFQLVYHRNLKWVIIDKKHYLVESFFFNRLLAKTLGGVHDCLYQ